MCEDTPCINACPTDALEKGVAIEDARMGLAVLIDQETCLAFQGLRCEVCYRACPLMGKAHPPRVAAPGAHGQARLLPAGGELRPLHRLREVRELVHPRGGGHQGASPGPGQGQLGEHYRFGWKEEARVSRDFTAPEGAPDLPEWDKGLEKVLEAMDDLSGDRRAVSWIHTHRYWLARRTVQVGILASLLARRAAAPRSPDGQPERCADVPHDPLADPYAVLQILGHRPVAGRRHALLGAAIVLLFYALFAGRASAPGCAR